MIMKKQLKVGSSKLKVNEKNFLFLFFFIVLLVTFNLSLVTVVDADDVQSRAAVVMEASTGRILYAKNPNLRLLPASTTKLMTAIIVLEEANLSDVVRISKNVPLVAPLKAGFKEGDEVTIETLLYAALLKSANDAAVALAEAVAGSEEKFVYLMNKKAANIGMMDTKFINANGLPGPDQHITAFDLSIMMRYALRYPKLKEIIGTRVAEVSTEKGKDLFLKNTNRLLWSDEDLIGGKTGYTRKARHCFVCAAERDNGTVIVALLGSPSRVNLWEETETLLNKGFDVLANKEEPVIYFTKADYDVLDMKKASYRNNLRNNIKAAKFKAKNKLARKKGETKASVKKRGHSKKFTKNKKLKDYKALKKKENGNTG
jgi:D-alanyl-D-alanine carboxypeptidase (penicillin-binding protein 5/6)